MVTSNLRRIINSINNSKSMFVRESSFSILGTGAEDSGYGYETILRYTVGVRQYEAQYLWDTKPFCLK